MFTTKTRLLIVGVMCAGGTGLLLMPGTALAHHPGLIGPVRHLGTDTIIRVALAALLDGINPSAFGVLLLLCRRAVASKNPRAGRSVLAYISGIVVLYLAAGVGLRSVYANFGPSLPIMLFQIVIAGLLFLSGLQEFLNALRRQQIRLVEIPPVVQTTLQRFGGLLDKGLAFPLGMFIGLLELFATGAIYLSFIQAITYDPTAPWWVLAVMMAIYMIIFVIPLVLAYSYRGLLAGDLQAESQRAGRIAQGIIGGFFMVAAVFIAASAIVTIRAISSF